MGWCYHERYTNEYESTIDRLRDAENRVNQEYWRLRNEYKQLKKDYNHERRAKTLHTPPIVAMEEYQPSYQNGSIF